MDADPRDARSREALRLAAALNTRGLRCKDEARYDEGRALYERALALLEATTGPHGDAVATLYHNLAGIAHARGDYAAAEPLARRGLDIRRRADDHRPGDVAADEIALAAILDGLGRYDESERLYLGALRVFERARRRHAPEIAVALNNLGALHARRGDLDRAADLLDRAVALKRRTLGPDHPDVAVTQQPGAGQQAPRRPRPRRRALRRGRRDLRARARP